MYGSDLQKRLGILLTIVGAILACAVPFALVVLRQNALDELSNPTPEELRPIHSPLIAAVVGMVIAGVGVGLIYRATRK